VKKEQERAERAKEIAVADALAQRAVDAVSAEVAARVLDVIAPGLDTVIGEIEWALGLRDDAASAGTAYKIGIARHISRQGIEPFIRRIKKVSTHAIEYRNVETWRAIRNGGTADDADLPHVDEVVGDTNAIDQLLAVIAPDLDKVTDVMDAVAGISKAPASLIRHRLWLARRVVVEGMPGYLTRTLTNVQKSVDAYEIGPEHARRVQALIAEGYERKAAVMEVALRASERRAADGTPDPEPGFAEQTWNNEKRSRYLKP
jgi:hypothetical protein